MSADKLSLEIAALEKQSSKAKNAVIKKVLLKKIDKLKVELEAITSAPVAKAKIQRAKTKISQMSPKEFADYIKKLSKDPKYSFLKGMSSDEIARDVKRTAKPVGWRFRGRQNFKTPTKRDVKDNNNVYYENRRNRSDVSRSLRLETGGGVGDKIVAPNGYVFSKVGSHRAEQKVKRMGVEYITLYSFGGSQGTAGASNIFISEKDYDKIKGIIGVSNSKKAIKGDNHIFSRGENKKVDSVFRSIEQKYAEGGGIDINELNMPVIRTQFEDEDYEFEDGGEVTANERMQSLKNYPKLKF